MRGILVLLLTLGLMEEARAAIPSQPFGSIPQPTTQKNKTIENNPEEIQLTTMALRLPLENRLQALKDRGDSSRRTLQQMSSDDTLSMHMRWRAMLALGVLYPLEAEPLLEQAVKSQSWFLRNAGMLALSHGRRETALKWAEKLLSDPALVVRTAAVQTLEKINATEKESLLWQKLNAAENFKNGQSLWVRRHIAKTLARFARAGQERDFAKLLNDPDPRIHPHAVAALRKIAGNSVDKEAKTFSEQRQAWLNWWSTRGG